MMKKLITLFAGISFVMSTSVFATVATQQEPVSKQQLQKAAQGCQKPLGFFPTPSKLICLLTAIGKTEKDIKPKAMAVIFSTCQGHLLQPQQAGTAPKKYATLAACLKDPAALESINKELAAQGFSPVTVVNPSVLSVQQ